ncbi:Alpha/Beta hydrolase protein [Mycena metata]|uniref:Alpha/Beta hydrolase protein n=1 Tax=Mycena metata TaxID=1033252 RepID=A0AAD7MGD0_9AGAR|nr:Alpha/Beta hydrolase protein [Mycena metata]
MECWKWYGGTDYLKSYANTLYYPHFSNIPIFLCNTPIQANADHLQPSEHIGARHTLQQGNPNRRRSRNHHGFIDPSSPAVRQFLGVPFALPPTGARRWLPPMAFNNSSVSINTTAFGPTCPQVPLSTQLAPDVFSAKGGNRTEFFPVEEFSKDCLSLNVWTPVSTEGIKLPVLCTQGYIVVSANYRVNIFDFPNAPRLADHNLSRIVAWGESSGTISVDFLHFLLPADPIVYGSIMESSTPLVPAKISLSNDTTYELPAEDYCICIKFSVDLNKLAVQTFNPRD